METRNRILNDELERILAVSDTAQLATFVRLKEQEMEMKKKMTTIDSSNQDPKERNTKFVEFASLSDAEKQAWVDFCFHEIHRHQEDIDRVNKELTYIKERYKIEPRATYVATWVLIK